jgi:hypothetical protein
MQTTDKCYILLDEHQVALDLLNSMVDGAYKTLEDEEDGEDVDDEEDDEEDEEDENKEDMDEEEDENKEDVDEDENKEDVDDVDEDENKEDMDEEERRRRENNEEAFKEARGSLSDAWMDSEEFKCPCGSTHHITAISTTSKYGNKDLENLVLELESWWSFEPEKRPKYLDNFVSDLDSELAYFRGPNKVAFNVFLSDEYLHFLIHKQGQ